LNRGATGKVKEIARGRGRLSPGFVWVREKDP